MKLPRIVGKLIYIVNYPFIYGRLSGTSRAYVVICANNRVLFTKNWLGLHHDWRLPGGGIKDGEDEITAVIREVAEEVGVILRAGQLRLLTSRPIKAKRGYNYLLYEAQLTAEPKLVINEREIVSAGFVEISHVNKLPLAEIARTAVTVLGWS